MRDFIEGFKEQFKGFWKGLLPKDWKMVGEMTAYFICMFGLGVGAFLFGSIMGLLVGILLES